MFGKSKSGNTKNSRGNKLKEQTRLAWPEVAANAQQQNRIIAYFVNGQKIAAVPEGEVQVSPEQRREVMRDLASGRITGVEIEAFLRNVAIPPQETKEELRKIFGEISEDLRQKQILAVLAGYNATDWQNVNAEDLRTLRGKPLKGQPNYRTPVGFEVFREKFLEGIADKADAEQMQEYMQAMDGLERKIYGRRFEYYQQILLLEAGEPVAGSASGGGAEDLSEASSGSLREGADEGALAPGEIAPSEIDAIIAETIALGEADDVAGASDDAGAGAVAADGAMVAGAVKRSGAHGAGLPELATYIAVSPERSAEIMSQAVIMGDPWRQGGNEYLLTPNNLTGNGLVPAFELSIGAETVALTQPFELSDGRGAALGFMPTSEGAKVRGFYLDPKTGLWHFAPDVIRGARGEGMSQITEGYGENSTMLPVVLQKNLTEIVKNVGFREITTVNPDFLFAGTAVMYGDMQEYRDALARGQARGDFYREVDAEPVVVMQASEKNKTLPQLISVNAAIAPDFEKHLGHFVTYSLLAGQVKVDSFASADGHLTWMFCGDEYGRTWIGGIEVSSDLTSTGCRKNWAVAGDLMTPLYEYSTQSGNYGDPSDMRKGMVGMWNQYLSKIGLIQDYVGWRGRNRL